MDAPLQIIERLARRLECELIIVELTATNDSDSLRIVYWNREQSHSIGIDVESALGKKLREGAGASLIGPIADAAVESMQTARQLQLDGLPKCEDDDSVTYRTTTTPLTATLVGIVIENVTTSARLDRARSALLKELQKSEAEIGKLRKQIDALLHQDPLTGLLNRRGLISALNREQERMAREDTRVAGLLIDCDDFRQVNEEFGYDIGDELLLDISTAIRSAVRPTDHCARLAADQFVVLLADAHAEDGGLVAERVNRAVGLIDVPVPGGFVGATCSIGWAWLAPTEFNIDALFKLTAVALERAKESGKDEVSQNLRAAKSEPPARGANDGGPSEKPPPLTQRGPTSLGVVSQPIWTLSTPRLVGYELCTRGPAGRLEMPEQFLRASVESRHGSLVDLSCLRACSQAAALLPAQPVGPPRVHINVFPSTLMEHDSLAAVLEVLAETTRSGLEICLELSERRISGVPGELGPAIQKLRAQNILVALDRAGLSRTCLESLIALRPDFVKIDPCFVSGCATDPGKRRLLKRLASLAASLEISAIAVGIESQDELEVAAELGIEYGQGYHWGRPARLASKS